MSSIDRTAGATEMALKERTVLFVTGFTDIESKLTAWLPDIPTGFVPTVSEAYAAFDSSVAIVCVSENQLDDRMEEFRTDVLARHPFCQFIVIESDLLANDRVDNYDVILQGPVPRDVLRATVQERLKYEVYSTLLQEYYLSNMRSVTLSRLHDTEDAVPEHIPERLRELCTQLQDLQAELSEDQIREVSRTVERHREYLNQPTKQREGTRTSKYHPGTCPNCGLVWGDDYGNELGTGFEALGAGVWKCSRCEEIIHSLHDSNQRIMKG